MEHCESLLNSIHPDCPLIKSDGFESGFKAFSAGFRFTKKKHESGFGFEKKGMDLSPDSNHSISFIIRDGSDSN